MRMYFAAVCGLWRECQLSSFFDITKVSLLESFAYMKEHYIDILSLANDVLIDSGAFTIMNAKTKKDFDYIAYTKKYGEWVKRYNVEKFIELDIDGVFGKQVYLDCLHRLEDIVGRSPIPVFHRWRGKEYFLEIVKKHKFVCFGDVSIGGGSKAGYSYFKWFIDEAHKQGCWIHGLGMTTTSMLRCYDFDSVDSSTWIAGRKFGAVKRFNGHDVITYHTHKREDDKRVSTEWVTQHNFQEYCKYAYYCEFIK